MLKKKITKIIIATFIVVVSLLSFFFLTNNTQMDQEEVYMEIPTGSNYESVLKMIKPYLKNQTTFDLMAQFRAYDEHVKPGRFLIKKGMNAFQIVSALRRNVPVSLAFNNLERLEDLCQRISTQLEPDTTQLRAAFRDPAFLKQHGFTNETVLAMFLPNTYEFYWNTTAEKFRDKMLQEYKKFWNKERLAKASQLNMTAEQVITLAAIVHKETVKKSERPIVAGVYLNRLKQDMPLQADPTVIYAIKLRDNDFHQVIKRVLYNDLFIASPYNTYQNVGLPPGPIAMPDIDAIDAVLNATPHDYLYFCADTEKFGYHVFAASYEQHQKNAKKYADWLNAQGTTR